MMNTLNRVNPIRLPKLNTNLLSVISLIVLCMIVFVTTNTVAEACEELAAAVVLAKTAVDVALAAVDVALELRQAAVDTGIQVLIDIANAAVELALEVASAAADWHSDLVDALIDCLNNNQMDSGSCDSGSCG